MKIGVLSNPLSRRNRRQLAPISAYLQQCTDVHHVCLERFEALDETLFGFATEEVELLVVNGGDGTLSAVMTALWERRVFRKKPLLAVLPGGTSNTIAADVGLRGRPLAALKRLIRATVEQSTPLEVQQRALIRVSYDSAKTAVCGMFFGTAAICDAIELRRRMFPQSWLPDPLAAGLTLIYVLFNTALGRENLLDGKEISIALDDAPALSERYALVVVTSLDKILLGSDPFWGVRNGELKITTIRSPARRLARDAYRLLYGRDRSRLNPGSYQSAAVDKIELNMRCPFNLDGEFYQAPPGECVTLSSPGYVEFVR